jgi:hypothetical protein
VCFAKLVASAFGIVGCAEQTQIFQAGSATARKRLAVLDGDEALLQASPTLRIDERALKIVALPNSARNVERNVA